MVFCVDFGNMLYLHRKPWKIFDKRGGAWF